MQRGPLLSQRAPCVSPYPLGGLCSLFIPWKTLGTGATGEGTPRLAGGMTVRRPFRWGEGQRTPHSRTNPRAECSARGCGAAAP